MLYKKKNKWYHLNVSGFINAMNKKIIIPIILIALTSCSNENFISSSSLSSSFVSSSSSVYSISSEIKDE